MKSGTTYLSELLDAHPAVFVSSEKEPCYFVDQRVLRRAWPYRNARWGSLDAYLALFSAAADAPVIAEASTPYSQVPMFAGVPQRILTLSPDARFIYLMRDPIERTISHYWHRVRWWGENRPILRALRSDRHYTDVSNYALQLRAYLRFVTADRVLAITHETLVNDPLSVMRSVYAWLGVDDGFRPPGLDVPLNVTPPDFEQARGLGLLYRLKRTTAYHAISRFVPRPVRALGSRFASRPVKPAETSREEVERYLRPRQQREVDELTELLGRTFPEWRTLYPEKLAREPEAIAPAIGRVQQPEPSTEF